MIRRNLLALIISLFCVLTSTQNTLAADKTAGEVCTASDKCPSGYSCQFDSSASEYLCQKDPFQNIFGRIQAPDALKGLLQQDSSGAGGISQFLSSLVALIYSLAFVALIFMLIWGAFDWMTSGGDKEKLSKAQQKIINAFIGILLFAIAFAVIRILGQFTGFTFFVQKP